MRIPLAFEPDRAARELWEKHWPDEPADV